MNKAKKLYRDIIFRLFVIKPKNTGRTSFAPLKILPEYTVDLEKAQVIGVLKHNDKVYLTVIVDVLNNKLITKGSLRRIKKHTRPFKKHNYIEIIKGKAEYLIVNKISNPKEHNDKFFN